MIKVEVEINTKKKVMSERLKNFFKGIAMHSIIQNKVLDRFRVST